VLILLVLIASVAIIGRRARDAKHNGRQRAAHSGFRVSTSTRPDLIVMFRHCEKAGHVCGKGTSKFPDCCVSAQTPPFSCDDCSTQGYLRAQGLPASMKNLLTQIAQGATLTSVYAAGSREMNSACSHSRRMWEIATPLAASYSLPINTAYCSDQVKEAAESILRDNPGGYVAVAWEHTAIPALAGWLIALSKDPRAARPAAVNRWPGGGVFDQYWIIDLRSGSPVFVVAPEKILPTDCPYARQPNGACVPPQPRLPWGVAPWEARASAAQADIFPDL
jgi:hypothetical protein